MFSSVNIGSPHFKIIIVSVSNWIIFSLYSQTLTKEAKNVKKLQGDSGGPLHCEVSRGEYVVCGVTSAGTSICGADQNKPGIYTRVSKYIEWIKRVTTSKDSFWFYYFYMNWKFIQMFVIKSCPIKSISKNFLKRCLVTPSFFKLSKVLSCDS